MCIRVTSPRKFVKMQIAGPHLGFLFHWYGLGPNNLIFCFVFRFHFIFWQAHNFYLSKLSVD